MPNINAAHIHQVRLQEQGGDPGAPAATYVYIYAKSDGLYFELSDSTVVGPLNVGDLTQAAADLLYAAIANGVTAGDLHDHAGVTTQKLAQANTHESPDTDVATTSLHHTLGVGANQAAAGNHTHAPGVGEVSTLNFVIDGGGSAITTGIKGDVVVDYACTISAWTLLADTSGSIKIDVWVEHYADYPPTDADSICNGHEPEIAASGVKAQDTDLSDWATNPPAIEAGQTIRFNVDSAATITRATLALKLVRS